MTDGPIAAAPDAGPRFVVVGDAVLDVSVTLTEPMRPSSDIPAAVQAGAGGQGANVAVRLAVRGARVALVCGLGADPAGRLLRDELDASGVTVRSAAVGRTGIVAIVVDETGERTMLSQRATLLDALEPSALDVAAADWVLVSGYVLTESRAARAAAAIRSRAQRRALLGCAVRAGTEASWLAAACELQPHVAVVSRDELDALVPDVDREMRAGALAVRLGGLVVVTSAEGAWACGDALAVKVRAVGGGRRAVDATGAGDAFAAALVERLARSPSWPPAEETVRSAMAEGLSLAREVVEVRGAQTRVPSESTAGAPRA